MRRGERRRPGAGGAGLGGVDRLLQRLVVRNPEDLGGGGERGPPLPGRAGGELPPGEKEPSRGPGIGARPAEMERVAQGRLVLGAAGARTLAAAALERQAPAENAGPGRVFADDRVEAAERRAGEKGGFGVAFRRVDRPRPGRETAPARRPEGLGLPANQRARACAKGYRTAALSPRSARAKPPRLSTRIDVR